MGTGLARPRLHVPLGTEKKDDRALLGCPLENGVISDAVCVHPDRVLCEPV